MQIIAAAAFMSMLGGTASGQESATENMLPYVSVAPSFIDGVHTSCDIRFLIRMGLEQGLSGRFASGTGALWLLNGRLHFLLKLGFPPLGDGPSIAPETVYLVSGYTTNARDFRNSDKSDVGYLTSSFRPSAATMSMLADLGVENRRMTIGFTIGDGRSSQFAIDLSRDRASVWESCRTSLIDDWLDDSAGADEAATDAAVAAAASEKHR